MSQRQSRDTRQGEQVIKPHSGNTSPEQPGLWHRAPHAPRWAVLLAFVAVGLLLAALPDRLSIGPRWLPLAAVVILLPLIVVPWLTKHPPRPKTMRLVVLLLLGILTLALLSGAFLLMTTLPRRTEKQAGSLLREAALLWASNVLVFALWYWELDGGGPLQRHLRGQQAGDFLFPQQTSGNPSGWVPHFVDYLFLAFTGATAFSPTDTLPLSRLAKVLMILEALISLVILVVLAARAVNIL